MSNVSVEQILLARAQPHVLAAREQMILAIEAPKGCSGEVVRHPVSLEPPFRPVLSGNTSSLVPEEHYVLEVPPQESALVRARLWVCIEQPCEWNRSELFLKGLSQVRQRVTMNIFGNKDGIVQQVVCHGEDLPVLDSAFKGYFEHSAISIAGRDDPLALIPGEQWAHALFLDAYPYPLYSNRLTSMRELRQSPYATLFASLAQLEPPALGIFQVVFQPVSPEHDWGGNIRALTDIEFKLKRLIGYSGFDRYAEQPPSGDRHQMAMEIETKAHNDKPIYAVALRIAAVNAGDRAGHILRSLAVVTGGIQHGGRPLRFITAEDYRGHIDPVGLRRMFVLGTTYRPGFLLNSEELTTLFHVPPPEVFAHIKTIVNPLEALPIPEALRAGSPIGFCPYAGESIPICIPNEEEAEGHIHVIGSSRTGKSTLLLHRILYHIRHHYGVAVFDPHGTLIRDLLCVIPPEEMDRIIYFDPGDPHRTPCYNLFACGVKVGPGRVTEDVVCSFKSFIDGWGDRLEHLLRHALFGVLHLPNSNLRDVADVLRKKSKASRRIREQLRGALGNDVAQAFWEEDFENYQPADLLPPAHKLSKLLVSDTVGRMLSQEQSRFNLRDIMDSRKVLLIDLSSLGSDERNVLGSLLLSLLHLTALGRKGDGTDAPFRVYCDEAHRLLTDAMEDALNESLKFGLVMTLAHQQLAQLTQKKTHALASVGASIIFRVIQPDAQYLAKTLQGKVSADILETLDNREVVVRVGNQVVRGRTYPPAYQKDPSVRDKILVRSRELYYRPAAVVDAEIRARRNRWADPGQQGTGAGSSPASSSVTAESASTPNDQGNEVFTYESF